MTYVLFDDNNKIIGCSDSKATDDYIESSRDVIAIGNKFVYADDKDAIAQAEQEYKAEQERIANLPTTEQRVTELEQENEALNDTMLELIEQFETAISAE